VLVTVLVPVLPMVALVSTGTVDTVCDTVTALVGSTSTSTSTSTLGKWKQETWHFLVVLTVQNWANTCAALRVVVQD
jgi:hypothetical protein